MVAVTRAARWRRVLRYRALRTTHDGVRTRTVLPSRMIPSTYRVVPCRRHFIGADELRVRMLLTRLGVCVGGRRL
ncbi:hypothetical protein [Streptomyces sp. NPDC020141]|uniref:hypothetical protein n=1 Tax=Streptomyces sp. NPDC020141 TaxID=3365065 RepID=UPI003791D108